MRLQELRSQTRKLSWVGVSVEMLGLGITFSYDIQRYVSNDQTHGKLSGIKMHLSNFPAVTLLVTYVYIDCAVVDGKLSPATCGRLLKYSASEYLPFKHFRLIH
jgi:hypothetical protein